MTRFLGTHFGKLDAKGRISIPAPFRGVLRGLGGDGVMPLVLRPSHRYPCIEAWPAAEFEKLAAPVERLDMFGDDFEDMAATVYANAHPVESDREGRIVLPDGLVSHAALTDSVMFMSLGRIFQIWEPVAGARRNAEATLAVNLRKQTVAAVTP